MTKLAYDVPVHFSFAAKDVEYRLKQCAYVHRRIRPCLRAVGLPTTWGAIYAMTDAELLAVKGIGRRGVRTVRWLARNCR